MALITRPQKKSALDRRKITNPVIQTRNRLIAAAVIGFVLCLVLYFVYTAPALAKNSTANQALSAAQAQLATANSELTTDVNTLQLQAASTYQQTQALDNLLPTNLDPSSMELTLFPPLIARSGAVGPNQYQTPTLIQQFGASVYQFNLQISGSYSQITEFMRLILAQPQLITITGISLNASAATSKSAAGYVATIGVDAWFLPGVGAATQASTSTATTSTTLPAG